MDERPIEDFKEDVLGILECPICYETMEPPIALCSTGHSICSTCRVIIDKCPVCKSSIHITSRNYSLEKLSALFGVPCCYNYLGCEVKLSKKKITEHEKCCPCKSFNCPMLKNMMAQCLWKGNRQDLINHVMDNHSANLFRVPIEETFYLTTNFHRHFFHDVAFLHCADQHTFVSHDIYDETRMKYWKDIQYFGSVKDASKFKYVMEIASQDKSVGLKYHRTVHSNEEDIHRIIDSEACFAISKEQLKHYLHDDVALINIRIEKTSSSL